MGTYKKMLNGKNIPVTEAIPGRGMVKNNAGGYAYEADIFEVLKRWLLLGTTGNSFYQSAGNATKEGIEILMKCMKKDADKVADLIIYASDKGLNNHTPIIALTYLSIGNFYCKKKFKEIFPVIIRTGSHLYEFMSYCKTIRGMGKTIHKAILSWLGNKSLEELEYQFLKYQAREGWSARDILRLMKPIPKDKNVSTLYSWVVGKYEKLEATDFSKAGLNRISAYEILKKNLDDTNVVDYVREYNLTQEMIPSNITRTKEVWEALFEKMPVSATIRNLGNLTNKGIFEDSKNLEILDGRFTSKVLKRGRVHPLSLASALVVYKEGGSLGRSSLEWTPNKTVIKILTRAIELSFNCIESTGKKLFHALDISGSMSWKYLENLWLFPYQIAGIIALATVKSEENSFVGAFSGIFEPLKEFNKTKNFDYVSSRAYTEGKGFGGTNAGSAIGYAIKNKIDVDAFIFWTDSENWRGRHVSALIEGYRKKINRNAKMIFVTLCSNKTTQVMPDDKLSYDIAGFSSETPNLLKTIISE